MMRRIMTGAALLALAGAAPAMAAAAGRMEIQVVEQITYETQPCFGFCPVYRVSVRPDGQGSFTGDRNTAVTGTRAFTVTPAQYAAFRDRLKPWLPANGTRRIVPGAPACRRPATDLPGVTIGWTHRPVARGRGWAFSRLEANYGCDMDRNRAMFEALRSAPGLLPIAAMIGAPHRP